VQNTTPSKMDLLGIVNLIFLFLLMLGMGVAINVEKFKENFIKPRGIVVGVICQFILMPPLVGTSSCIQPHNNTY
jgi:predicted Na+-dependent transporter